MTDIDVLKVGLDNVQALLKKIDENQTKLFETQNQHSKELERLNGLIEKNTSTTQLELKAISTEIKSYYEKAKESVDKLETKVRDFENKTNTKIDDLEEKLDSEVKSLKKDLASEVKALEIKIDKNTEFRQNMKGFSMVRHGIPFLMFLIGVASLIFAIVGG